MRYEYSSGFEEFKLAVRTYVRSSARRRFWFHMAMWGYLLLGISLLVLFSLTSGHLPGWFGVVEAGLVGGLVGGGVVTPLLRPFQLRRAYKAWNGDLKEPMQVYLELSGELLVSGIQGRSEGRFERTAFCDFAEDDQMVLLFVTKKKYLYFAKHSLPPEAVSAIRDFYAGKVTAS